MTRVGDSWITASTSTGASSSSDSASLPISSTANESDIDSTSDLEVEESHDQESNPVVSLFSPQKAYMLKPTSTSLEQSLLSLPFFAQSEIDGLKEELPSYLTRAVDVDEQFDSLEWWKLNTISLPRWSAAVRRALLVQPSSAAAKRVFSLLKLSFGDQQDNSLQDYIEASLMLQFNKR